MPTDTGLSLYNKILREGAYLFERVLDDVVSGKKINSRPQNLNKRKYYRRSDALDGHINWNWSAKRIVDFIRAGNYHPFASPTYTAMLTFHEKVVLILRGKDAGYYNAISGNLIELTTEGPRISCGNNESVILCQAIYKNKPIDFALWEQFFNDTEGEKFKGQING